MLHDLLHLFRARLLDLDFGAGATDRILPQRLGFFLEACEFSQPLLRGFCLKLAGLPRHGIDALIDGDLKEGALRYAEKLVADGKGPRRTSERNVDSASCTPAILERMNALAAKLYPNRVAPYTAIKAVKASLELPLAKGLEYETELANESKVTPESKGSIHAFFAERETRKVPDLPANVEARPVKTAGVVGAGTMGGGVAICFANASIPVTVLDASEDGLKRGIAGIDKTYESMVKRGRITADEKKQRMALITQSTQPPWKFEKLAG